MDANETLALIADAASAAEWYAMHGRLDSPMMTFDAIACVARGNSTVSQRVALDVLVEDWKRETAFVEAR
jgi:hypothetical protein